MYSQKRDYTKSIIVAVIIVLVLFFIANLYELTEKFQNWYKLEKKINSFISFDNSKKNREPVKTNCVCSFDLDYTLSHTKEPKRIVDICKNKGCILSINTARPTDWIEDIPLKEIGFYEPYFNKEDHYYNPNSYSQTPREVGDTKSFYLQHLKNKYNISNKKCVVLFDDASYNLQSANRNGFSTIQASHRGNLGLTRESELELESILHFC